MPAQMLLFHYCRKGDLQKVRHLVEDIEVDVNIRDEWDSTPLYYACLCGHADVVEYLLQNGSKCLENSFDGERCLYGALSDEIRTLVRNWKQVHAAGLQQNRHYELMTMLLDKGYYSDVAIVVHGKKFNLHRCILAARSEYFHNAFATKWKNTDFIAINNCLVTKEAFTAIVQYIYTGRLDANHSIIDDITRLAKNCKLLVLLEEIEKSEAMVNEMKNLKPALHRRIKVFSVESQASNCKLLADLRKIVDQLIPPSANDWIDNGVLPFTNFESETFFSDVCFCVQGHRFYGHQAFLCGYSEYFRAHLMDHFSENSQDNSLPMVTLKDISVTAFKSILLHAYADSVEINDGEAAYELLTFSHMLLMNDLSRRCGKFLAKCVDGSNIFSLYLIAKQFELDHLTYSCTAYMARNLEKMVEQEEFGKLIEDDAASVLKREETDSVPLVDDIRYHVSNSLPQSFGDLDDCQSKLAALDLLLYQLGIDC